MSALTCTKGNAGCCIMPTLHFGDAVIYTSIMQHSRAV